MWKKWIIKSVIWLTYPIWIRIIQRVVERLTEIELLTPVKAKMVMAFFDKKGLSGVLWPEDLKDQKVSE